MEIFFEVSTIPSYCWQYNDGKKLPAPFVEATRIFDIK
jgi:hypothetical protein